MSGGLAVAVVGATSLVVWRPRLLGQRVRWFAGGGRWGNVAGGLAVAVVGATSLVVWRPRSLGQRVRWFGGGGCWGNVSGGLAAAVVGATCPVVWRWRSLGQRLRWFGSGYRSSYANTRNYHARTRSAVCAAGTWASTHKWPHLHLLQHHQTNPSPPITIHHAPLATLDGTHVSIGNEDKIHVPRTHGAG